MGASIGMAKGAADAGLRPALAVIGDSTFLHSGVTPLMDAAAHDTDMTLLILDNETVAMTGGAADGRCPTRARAARAAAWASTPTHVHVVDAHPREVHEIAELLRREIAHRGLSVIVALRECIVTRAGRKKSQKAEGSA